MKNLWIQTEHDFATWVADFTAIATQPAAILEFAQAVLASGAAHRIFEMVEAPVIGYRRDRDGSIGDALHRLFERDKILDLFGFTGSAMMPGSPTSSTVETTSLSTIARIGWSSAWSPISVPCSLRWSRFRTASRTAS
jgi:hypothetical protein